MSQHTQRPIGPQRKAVHAILEANSGMEALREENARLQNRVTLLEAEHAALRGILSDERGSLTKLKTAFWNAERGIG